MSRFNSEVGYNIQLYSGCEYKRLVAEIYYNGKLVATVIQEENLGKFEILFPDNNSNAEAVTRKIGFDGFCDALENAKNELREK